MCCFKKILTLTSAFILQFFDKISCVIASVSSAEMCAKASHQQRAGECRNIITYYCDERQHYCSCKQYLHTRIDRWYADEKHFIDVTYRFCLLEHLIAAALSAVRLKHISLNYFELFKWCASHPPFLYCIYFTFQSWQLTIQCNWVRNEWPTVCGSCLQFIWIFPVLACRGNFNTALFLSNFYITMGILKQQI